MTEKDKQNLIKELEIIQQQIDDVKLNDGLDVKELKRLLNERGRIEFRLGLGN